MACVVIVGGGISGLTAALTSRKCWPDRPVIVIDAEREIGYYRSLLPQFMAGRLDERRLFFLANLEDPFLTIRTGVRVTSLDRTGQRVFLENGERIEYDRLILAIGKCPNMPGLLAEQSCGGIFPIRDFTTAKAIREWLPGHREIVIIGGSLVAVKTAIHLKLAGLNVSLVIRRDHTLLRLLTPRAAQLVDDHLRRMEIYLLVNSTVGDIAAKNGSIDAVKVGTRWLPCNTLLVAAGAIPGLTFLQGTGLLEDGELLVSPTLQTSDRKIFATGDVATISTADGRRINPATWPQASIQGRLAACNLYRTVPAPLNTLTAVNCLNLNSLPIVVLGPPVEGAEQISYFRPGEGLLRELFLLRGEIVGGALTGDISGAGPLHAMMNSRREIDPRVEALLRPGERSFSHLSIWPGLWPGRRLEELSI